MKKLTIIILLPIFSFLTCFSAYSQKIQEINVEPEINNITSVKCSEFINEFKYILLSTEKESLIDKFPNVDILDDYIVIQTINTCFIFELESGRFIRKIGKKGRGPNEYRQSLKLVDRINKSMFFKGWSNNILEFNVENELIRSINIPFIKTDFKNPSLPSNYGVYKNFILCYFGNNNGKEKKLIVAIDKENSNPQFIIPNKNIFEDKTFKFSTNENQFYHFDNKFYFKELYNDTIFELIDDTLEPHLLINTGKYHFDYEEKWNFDPFNNEFVFPYKIIECDNGVYFYFTYNKKKLMGIFNKTEKNIKVIDSQQGLINDIDRFVNFRPTNYTPNGQLIGLIDAFEIVNWFSNNRDKVEKLPSHIQKLKNIKETDNPVVMIAKLKE